MPASWVSWCGKTPQSAVFTGEANADNCPVLHCCVSNAPSNLKMKRHAAIPTNIPAMCCYSILSVILESHVQSFRAWPLLLLPMLVNMKLASWTGQSFERMKQNSKSDLGRTQEASSEQICLKLIVYDRIMFHNIDICRSGRRSVGCSKSRSPGWILCPCHDSSHFVLSLPPLRPEPPLRRKASPLPQVK